MLGLGTAQFGMDYGISNVDGQVAFTEAYEILSEAQSLGITLIDTAHTYGESEKVIGSYLSADHGMDIVTKLPPLKKQSISNEDVVNMEVCFFKSLSRLRQPCVYGLLLHDANDLFLKGGEQLWEMMTNLKVEGKVKKIGISVYSAPQIENTFASYEIDLVQLPINVLDQRFLQGNLLINLKRLGVEIHTRSVFLQGLLLLEPDQLPAYFTNVKYLLTHYHQMMAEYRLKPIEAALIFIREIEELDYLIIGVTSSSQLREVHQAFHRKTPEVPIDFSQFSCPDECIINPSLWPRWER